jgi:enolase
MTKIEEIIARQIMDSRGKPTVEVELHTDKGVFKDACPSGTSSGANEALELRDADGKGVMTAVDNINKIIAPKLKGKNPENQKQLDELMLALDGTENKSKLGANAILPVSMAITRAGAASKKMPLYEYISHISENKMNIPYGMFNIVNGGAHAKNDLDIQEFMVVPQKKTFAENLVLSSKIFQALTDALKEQNPELPAMGFEGGYAPLISNADQALYLLQNAIGDNKDVSISLDCAASEFYKDGKYVLEGKEMSRQQMVDFYKDLVKRFPIITIEDPFSEEDWEGFKDLHKELRDTVIIGDDLTTTNIKRIKEAEQKHACNGIIIKLNQIGSVWETIEAVNLAKKYGWKIVVSHRSGETTDDFIADLAVGVGADFLKAGAYTREERVVKYNRLLAIEQELTKK